MTRCPREGSRFGAALPIRQFYRTAAGGSRKLSRMFAPAQDFEALPTKTGEHQGSWQIRGRFREPPSAER
jgi:hypothetical protein